MDAINRLLVTYLINATWEILLITAITAVCSRLLRRVASEYRHLVWVAALILSVLLPLWSLHNLRLQNAPSTRLLTPITFETTTSNPAPMTAAPVNSASAGLWSRLPRHGPAISLSPVLTWSFVVCYTIFFSIGSPGCSWHGGARPS